jgi:hypothetical protein
MEEHTEETRIHVRSLGARGEEDLPASSDDRKRQRKGRGARPTHPGEEWAWGQGWPHPHRPPPPTTFFQQGAPPPPYEYYPNPHFPQPHPPPPPYHLPPSAPWVPEATAVSGGQAKTKSTQRLSQEPTIDTAERKGGDRGKAEHYKG